MLAARYNSNLEVLQLLIENGANVTAEDQKGSNALWYASQVSNRIAYSFIMEKMQITFSDPVAQFRLGNHAYIGNRYSIAAEWYRKAAEQGHAEAQYKLGFMYQNGRGVKKDDKQAAEWYRKAAAQGNKEAERALQRLGLRRY